MSEIIFPSEVLPEIDWENPLTDGFDLTAIVNDGSIYFDREQPLSSSIPTFTGDSVLLNSGRHITYNRNFTGDFSIIVTLGIYPRANNTSYFLLGQYATLNTGYSWGLYRSGGSIAFFYKTGVNVKVMGNADFPNDGSPVVFVISREGSVFKIKTNYSDEVSVTDTVSYPSTYDFTVSNRWGSSSDYSNARLYNLQVKRSALTSEEIQSITENPHQLYKRKVSEQQEYGLVFNGTDGQGLVLSGLGSSYYVKMELGADLNLSNGDYLFDGRYGNGLGSAYFYRQSDGNMAHGSNINTLRLNGVAASPNQIGAALKGDIIQFNVSNQDGNAIVGSRYNMVNPATKLVLTALWIEYVNTATNKFWEFNQTFGTQVKDHYNGDIATLVGFTPDSGYMYDDVTGQSVGYQFTATTITTLNLTGTYTGTITYSDDSTLTISGSDNYVVNTGIVKRIEATDTLGSYDWDGATGDDDQLIDVLSNNHAAIINSATDGFQPIVPVDVYTVGVGKDYDTLPLFSAALNADITSAKEAKITSTVGDTLTGFSQGLTLDGGDITSNLTINTSGITQIKNLTAKDVDASSAIGDVYLLNVEADNVTG